MSANLPSNSGLAAELEGLDPLGLQPVLLPNAMHGGRRQSNLFGQPPRTPVGRGLGLAQRGADDCLLFGPCDAPRPPSPWPIAQALQTLARVATAPQADGALGELQPLRKGSPAALLSTIRARIASACAMLCVRNHASNCARSAAPISTAHLFTPMQQSRTNPILYSEI